MPTAQTVKETDMPIAGVWQIDPSHSDLRITARHLMVAKVRGTFADFAGTIVVADDPMRSTVEFEARADSVTTGTPDRDNHLRSPDFLDAEQFPTITFSSTGLDRQGGDWRLRGDLTIRGVTRSAEFDLAYEGASTDPYGNTKAAFTARGEIDRRDWGLTWNVPLEGGGVLVSERFKVEFDVEAGLQS